MPGSQLDYFGRFKDPILQKEFILSCMRQRSNLSYALLTLMILGWAIAENVAATWYNDTNGLTTSEEAYGIFSLFFTTIGLLICATLCLPPFWNSFWQDHLVYSYLQAIFLVSINAVFLVKMIKEIDIGTTECVPRQVVTLFRNSLPANLPSNQQILLNNLIQTLKLYPCPPDDSFFSIVSYEKILVMSFCPQLLMAVIYEPRLYLVLACHITTGAFMLYSIYTSFFSILQVLIVFLIIAVLLTELHLQRVQSFLNQRKVQQLLEDNERNADENHAMEMRSMIGNVAHDLKTPLASFTNGLDVIKEIIACTSQKFEESNKEGKVVSSELYVECFSSIQTCLANIRNTNAFMLMTINRCIDYTKASKGMKLVPKYETVDLREALQFPIECMSNIQERIGIKLEAMSEEICSHIITDKQWLQENLLCLLSNAVKYSTEGSVTIHSTLLNDFVPNTPPVPLGGVSNSLTTGCSSSNTILADCSSALLFEIEDTGIGVSEEAMKNLFNPFKQAQRLAGGTGLGLYSLAKRMESLKGYYGIKKRKDGKQGSLFWFAIPYRPDEIASAAAVEPVLPFDQFVRSPDSIRLLSKSDKSPSAPLIDPLEILIVDDAPSILKMSSMMLKRQGHQIWTAENGEIALKRIEEKWRGSGKGFDLVLMDLQMPVMDGLEATRRLRAMESEGREWMKYPTSDFHQLIIGLSANSDHDTMKDALKSGVDDFFGKPFALETFNRMVEKFILSRN